MNSNTAAFVVPRDYNELVKDYGSFVARVIRRYDSVGRHAADLYQDCWASLLSSDVLTKFQMSLAKPSLTMTGEQAAIFLDVRFPTFATAMWVKHIGRVLPDGTRDMRGGWMPLPLKGTYSSRKAIYKTSDILALREAGRLKRRSPEAELPELPASDSTPTRGRFESYLTSAIHNHFANFCRSKERKDKDIYLAPCDDGSAWESGVADAGETPEDCAEVRMAMAKLGDQGMEVLRLLDQDYTLTKACARAMIPLAKIRMIVGR
jgi:DNA-directed RNA polymerase specialized sigma24 family protein